MLEVYQNWDQASQDLHLTLKACDLSDQALVLDADGFLPDYVLSPYRHYLYEVEPHSAPLYYNQLQLPDFWEIRADNQEAAVYDGDQLKARIAYYEPLKEKRLLAAVEWLDAAGQVRLKDLYDRYGLRFCQKSYLGDGRLFKSVFYNQKGQEIIYENHLTENLVLTQPQSARKVYPNRLAFFKDFMCELNLDQEKILFNHLGLPFFLTMELGAQQTILVWQEDIQTELPANLSYILEEEKAGVASVLVTKTGAYKKLQRLSSDSKISKFGLHYFFESETQPQKEALILTYSDQMAHLDSLLEAAKDWQFHIAAPTEMSPQLIDKLSHSNLSLYPNITAKKLSQLYAKCSIHLDIQAGPEFDQANRRSFLNNLINLAFVQTQHDRDYLGVGSVFSDHDWQGLVSKMEELLSSKEAFLQGLLLQGQAASYLSKEEIRQLLQPLIEED